MLPEEIARYGGTGLCVDLVAGDHLRLRGGEKIGDRHRLFTRWTKPALANTAAERPAIRAILVAEITGFAGWAFVNGAWSRRTRWNQGKRTGVAPPPRLLTAGAIAE